ncbi:hypothetical protein P280DRAFT_335101 [Massarina eburnea CBS 473.64]|uniref:Uncharacterized protein n=1 Tax=Massarina eburnea CBS 473.64 TaxID=1395130 RepID=A0A6A6RGJ8_9PLEO|nr:hypothetical protein P280DRAFT_335101 [Massarina eburnea CBS 473.64]
MAARGWWGVAIASSWDPVVVRMGCQAMWTHSAGYWTVGWLSWAGLPCKIGRGVVACGVRRAAMTAVMDREGQCAWLPQGCRPATPRRPLDGSELAMYVCGKAFQCMLPCHPR